MRAVVQRVLSASVSVNQEAIGQIQKGFLILLGVEKGTRIRTSTTLWIRLPVSVSLMMKRAA